MKFSVLMSVYGKDNPAFFREALKSVSSDQTLKPSQIVIVEDGPVPVEVNTAIDSLKNDNTDIEFTVLSKEKNEGLAAALNDGIALCKYKWAARMDSDDISAPDRFEKQVAFIENNPEVDIVGGYIDEFVEDPRASVSIRKVGLTHDDIKKMATTRTPMNHMSVFYSLDAVRTAGCYAVDFGKLEDYKLWVDMISSGAQFANLKDILVHVRIGNGFIARRSNKREINDWDMLQKYLLDAKMITKPKALKNKAYIRIFTYMPAWMKKIAYKTVLRK